MEVKYFRSNQRERKKLTKGRKPHSRKKSVIQGIKLPRKGQRGVTFFFVATFNRTRGFGKNREITKVLSESKRRKRLANHTRAIGITREDRAQCLSEPPRVVNRDAEKKARVWTFAEAGRAASRAKGKKLLPEKVFEQQTSDS